MCGGHLSRGAWASAVWSAHLRRPSGSLSKLHLILLLYNRTLVISLTDCVINMVLVGLGSSTEVDALLDGYQPMHKVYIRMYITELLNLLRFIHLHEVLRRVFSYIRVSFPHKVEWLELLFNDFLSGLSA